MADTKLERKFLHEFLQWKLDELEDYAATFESLLLSEQERLATDVKSKISNMPQNEKEELEDYYSSDLVIVLEIFPYVLRTGFLVSCCSFLEAELMLLCKYLENRHNYSLSPKDLRDKGIVLYQTYLKKVVQTSFPDQSNSWNEIMFFNDIRNVIVHRGGVVEKDSIKARIEKSQYMTVDHHNVVQLLPKFSEHAVVVIREFFEELFEHLDRNLRI